MDTQLESGRLVVLSGIDGSGKTTQAALLAGRLREEGRPVRLLSFPRYEDGFFGELIQRYLHGEFAGSAGEVSPYLAALPYACDRWEAASELGRWLDEGAVVISNRYVAANMAHQGSKIESTRERRLFWEWIERLEYGVFRVPRPHLCVLLDMPPQVAARLLEARPEDERIAFQDDIHESDPRHLELTAQAYREIAAGAPSAQLGTGRRWAVVACAAQGQPFDPLDIAAQVWEEVRQIL